MMNTTVTHAPPALTSADGARKLRILVIHQHYWPEIAATAQILADLCEDLAAFGHEVTVVCSSPSYRAEDIERTVPNRERKGGVDIWRVWTFVPGSRSISRRLLQYGSFFATSLMASLRADPPDVCLVMSTPPLLLGVTGTLLSALRGTPFLYSVQDLYPDIAVHLGVIPEKSLLTSAIEQVARVCYRSAAAVVTLSDGMGQRLRDKGLAPERVHVIPNWADTESVCPVPRDSPLARELGLDQGFVVQYSGNLGLSQGLEHVIDAAAALRDLPITFAFVGDGNAREKLVALAKVRGVDNVRFFPPQPRERLAELLSACDLGLVTMKRGVGKDLVPSKLYGIMAAARPVLASVEHDSEVSRVIQAHDCGWIVAPESAAMLADGVRAAYALQQESRAALGKRGRAACETAYSRRAITRRYEAVMRDVARAGKRAPDHRPLPT